MPNGFPLNLDGDRLNRRALLQTAAVAVGWICALPALARGEPEVVALPEPDAVPPPRFRLSWGQQGAGEGDFHSPIGIAINAADELFVSDTHNHRVQKFNTEGRFLAAFEVPRHPDPALFVSGGGIAVDGEGRVFVSQMSTHEIVAFAPDGTLLHRWGDRGAGDGQFDNPGGVAIGPDGNVYVCDQTNHRVQVFTPDGAFVTKWGEYGSQPGQFGAGPEEAISKARFGGPHFLAFDSQGHVFTTEGTVRRVQKLTAAGAPLSAWGDDRDAPGGFGGGGDLPGPIGICVDRQDRVWVGGTFHRVQCYAQDGRYLTGLTDVEGNGPGQFSVPHGMVVDSRDCLYVVDSRNQRVQKFAL